MGLKIKCKRNNECYEVISHRCNNSGYPIFRRKLYGKTYNLAHRYTYAVINGDFDDNLVVMHICDNPKCIRVSHLRLGTRGDNNRDRHSKGRTSRVARTNGIINGMSKLTEAQVREIRSEKSDLPQRILCQKYGITQTAYSAVKNRTKWRHIGD